jgi:hypothetical protein
METSRCRWLTERNETYGSDGPNLVATEPRFDARGRRYGGRRQLARRAFGTDQPQPQRRAPEFFFIEVGSSIFFEDLLRVGQTRLVKGDLAGATSSTAWAFCPAAHTWDTGVAQARDR